MLVPTLLVLHVLSHLWKEELLWWGKKKWGWGAIRITQILSILLHDARIVFANILKNEMAYLSIYLRGREGGDCQKLWFNQIFLKSRIILKRHTSKFNKQKQTNKILFLAIDTMILTSLDLRIYFSNLSGTSLLKSCLSSLAPLVNYSHQGQRKGKSLEGSNLGGPGEVPPAEVSRGQNPLVGVRGQSPLKLTPCRC